MTMALHSSPSVTVHADSRKQSFSLDFATSSGSPVREDSFDFILEPSKKIESAGIKSPAYNSDAHRDNQGKVDANQNDIAQYLKNYDITNNQILWVDAFDESVS